MANTTRWLAVTRWDGDGHVQTYFRDPSLAIGHLMESGTEGYKLAEYRHTKSGKEEVVARPTPHQLGEMGQGDMFTAYHTPTGAKALHAVITITLTVAA